MTNFCIITGALTIGYTAFYVFLRVSCWIDGREW
jgi:hypothetical protein